jgi:Xaa-Pro dipeptidase
MPFSAQRHAERRDGLRRALADQHPGIALIVTHLPNVRYLTGFSGSNAVLVVGSEPASDLLGTDGRYVDQVAAESPGLPTVIDRDTLSTVLAGLTGVVAVESGMSLGEAALVRAMRGDPIVTDGLVEGLRAVKDDDEVAALERATAITVAAFEQLATEIRIGMTELVLARRLEQIFGERGAEDRAFDSIVAAGPHSAIPHHQPGGRPLEAGDLVVVDAGARVEGYHADMTRTFRVGGSAEAWQDDIHAAVAEARTTAADRYRPGAEGRAIDAQARLVIADAGYGDRFTHGLGHGVGLEIHEAPNIGPRSTGRISSGMAITVEPGVYLPGRGGVRIEDTLVVTDAGPRILTEAPRDLRVVG